MRFHKEEHDGVLINTQWCSQSLLRRFAQSCSALCKQPTGLWHTTDKRAKKKKKYSGKTVRKLTSAGKTQQKWSNQQEALMCNMSCLQCFHRGCEKAKSTKFTKRKGSCRFFTSNIFCVSDSGLPVSHTHKSSSEEARTPRWRWSSNTRQHQLLRNFVEKVFFSLVKK